jgi:CYTH domain-containing protein
VENPSAPPGKSLRYARRELERRFLLARMPDHPIEKISPIFDRYIEGTRLRLRKKIEGDRTYYKLTQKVPAPDGSPGLLTTVYLNAVEYERFAALPALMLEKVRHSVGPFGIDVFAPPRQRLCVAEAEFETEAEMLAFVPPPWVDVVREITNDVRFTGGNYVTLDAHGVEALFS